MNFMKKVIAYMQKFMEGRYGTDQLTFVGIVISLVCYLFADFLNSWTLSLIAIVIMTTCYWRVLSRNIYKRRQENNKFMKKIAYIKSMRTHKYFKCPNCKQKLRVPRKKGRICITCPKCKQQIHKKS